MSTRRGSFWSTSHTPPATVGHRGTWQAGQRQGRRDTTLLTPGDQPATISDMLPQLLRNAHDFPRLLVGSSDPEPPLGATLTREVQKPPRSLPDEALIVAIASSHSALLPSTFPPVKPTTLTPMTMGFRNEDIGPFESWTLCCGRVDRGVNQSLGMGAYYLRQSTPASTRPRTRAKRPDSGEQNERS